MSVLLYCVCVCVCLTAGKWQQFHFLLFFCHSGKQANGANPNPNDFQACRWFLISFLITPLQQLLKLLLIQVSRR